MNNKEIARPWFPGSAAALSLAARTLRDRGQSHALVIYMCADAIAGQFQAVADAVESLCEVPTVGVGKLFRSSTFDSASVRIIYEFTTLPSRLFPLFALSIDFAIKFYVEKGLPKDSGTRQLILESVLSDENIKRLELHGADVNMFYALLKLSPPQRLITRIIAADQEKKSRI